MKAIVNIDVPDLAAAEAFYCEAFGLTVGRRMGADFLELLGAPFTLCLLARPRASSDTFGGSATERTYARHWTPLHLDLCVDDLDRAIARAVAAGATKEGARREDPYGSIQQLADPFGHGFCLIQFNARGYDAITTG